MNISKYFSFLLTGNIRNISRIEILILVFVNSFFMTFILSHHRHAIAYGCGVGLYYCLLTWAIILGKNKTKTFLRTIVVSVVTSIIYLSFLNRHIFYYIKDIIPLLIGTIVFVQWVTSTWSHSTWDILTKICCLPVAYSVNMYRQVQKLIIRLSWFYIVTILLIIGAGIYYSHKYYELNKIQLKNKEVYEYWERLKTRAIVDQELSNNRKKNKD